MATEHAYRHQPDPDLPQNTVVLPKPLPMNRGAFWVLFWAIGLLMGLFVRSLVDNAPNEVRWVVVAAEPITDVDTTAADELVELDDHLRSRGIELAFAEMKGPVKDRLERYGIADRCAQYPTLGTAVDAYVEATGTEWVDWEERDQDDEEPPVT